MLSIQVSLYLHQTNDRKCDGKVFCLGSASPGCFYVFLLLHHQYSLVMGDQQWRKWSNLLSNQEILCGNSNSSSVILFLLLLLFLYYIRGGNQAICYQINKHFAHPLHRLGCIIMGVSPQYFCLFSQEKAASVFFSFFKAAEFKCDILYWSGHFWYKHSFDSKLFLDLHRHNIIHWKFSHHPDHYSYQFVHYYRTFNNWFKSRKILHLNSTVKAQRNYNCETMQTKELWINGKMHMFHYTD